MKPRQNGIEGYFPQKIIPHAVSRCEMSYQASSRHFLFLAEHGKCGRTNIRYGILLFTLIDISGQYNLIPLTYFHVALSKARAVSNEVLNLIVGTLPLVASHLTTIHA